jgi:hypothetical protein
LAYYGHLCDLTTGYNLPVYLRNFYYKLLVDAKTKEAESYEDKGESPQKIAKPNINSR